MQLLKSYSWVILSEKIAYKIADKTLIQDKETGIPLDITPFFTNKQLEAGEELKSIKFLIDMQEQAISLKRKKDGRYKIVLKDPNNLLNVSQLLIDTDEVWFERDSIKPHVFHVYTRCSDFNKSIVPFQKLAKGDSRLSFSTQRIGQQYFRKNVIEECFGKCVVTKVKEQEPSILIASHIKPWVDSSDIEKVHGGNGLLLAPHIDKLFDSGLITFDDQRKIIMSPLLAPEVESSWNIDTNSIFHLTKMQQNFMIFHQDNVFKN